MLVIGSANVDLVVPIERFPVEGETLLARSLHRGPGGKGANQAVAAARAGGAPVAFLGAVGDDDHGRMLERALVEAGVDVAGLRRVGAPTGAAFIWVTPGGGNTIVVAAGANRAWQLDDEARAALADADVVLAQLEIDPALVLEAAAWTRGTVVLNAAPSSAVPDALLEHVDVLVVNEHEAADLAGERGEPARLAELLLQRVPAVVLTLGGAGALVVTRDGGPVEVPAHEVDVVDTTGAGDTFCGVLAASLAQGAPLVEACRRAGAAGALATTRPGAVDGIPTSAEVDALRRR
ncbi:ribokinase [uncultured Tessaracoccus sp.]|uniref:ribokinase n=1 Tax=uncultured Tessaracoccus sp. TaxID=905023 RepID=UPI0025DE8D55|nr:ribokinase [uncultured Tessaracoccus sp.]